MRDIRPFVGHAAAIPFRYIVTADGDRRVPTRPPTMVRDPEIPVRKRHRGA